MQAVLSTRFPDLPLFRSGKVRDVYDLGEYLLLVSTDRLSAFDVVMENGIPGKGILLNQLSAFWFNELEEHCPHHLVSIDDGEVARHIGQHLPELKGRCAIGKKASPIPVECVARGYIAGSLWKDYAAGQREIHGNRLPDGLSDSDRLPAPIFTPATKAQEGHDENISFDQMVKLTGGELSEKLRSLTLRIFKAASAKAEQSGLILADTKFEFGLVDGEVIWIDEALTPDSSRYWDATNYQPGRSQDSYDKQFVRNYLNSIQWNKQPPGPRLPEDVVQRTQQKYLEAFQRLTGHVLAL